MAGRYNFPAWNYGYTLGPAQQQGNGNYTTSHNFYGGYRGGGRGGRGGHAPPQPKPAEILFKKSEEASITPTATKEPPAATKEPPAVVAKVEKEEGEILEGEVLARSLQAILHGRNPVMFCNDESKLRNMHMEWEQVSEIGPPHDKTFEYQLKMGDLIGVGIGKCKKDSKTKAAEDMVIKLDQLPKVFNKRPFAAGPGGYMPYANNYGRGGFHGGPHFKKRRGESEEDILNKNDVTPKAVTTAQENPISKLFEFAKKKRWPEPLFDTIEENVLESRKVQQGFNLKKTEFTIRCTVRQGLAEEKLFLGKALTKKQAKHNSAATAWAEIGGGVTQASVENLLSGLKKEATEKSEDLAAKKAATDAAVDAVLNAAKSAAGGSDVSPPKSGGSSNSRGYSNSGGYSRSSGSSYSERGYNRHQYNRY